MIIRINKYDFSSVLNNTQFVFNLLNYLSSSEIEKAIAYVSNQKKLFFIIQQFVLKAHISKYYLFPYDKIFFSKRMLGKPFIENSKLKFNYSNEKNALVIASCSSENAEIGIDLCYLNRKTPNNIQINDYLQLMSSQFGPIDWSQINAIEDMENRLKTFYRFWALKESFYKMNGNGISLHFKKEHVQFKINESLNNDKIIDSTEIVYPEKISSSFMTFKSIKFFEILYNNTFIISLCVGDYRGIEKSLYIEKEFNNDIYKDIQLCGSSSNIISDSNHSILKEQFKKFFY